MKKYINEILLTPVVKNITKTSDSNLIRFIEMAQMRVDKHLEDEATYTNVTTLRDLLIQARSLIENYGKDSDAKTESSNLIDGNIKALSKWLKENSEITDEEWKARNTFSVETTPIRPKTWDGTLEGFMLLYYETLKRMGVRQFMNSGYYELLRKKHFDPVDIQAHYERYVCNQPWEYIKAKVRQAMKDSQSNPYYEPTSEIEKAILAEEQNKQQTATAVFTVNLETLESEPVLQNQMV